MTSVKTWPWAVKAAVLAALLWSAGVVSGMMMSSPAPVHPDGPFSSAAAAVVIAVADAVILSLLAARSRLGGWALGGLLAVVLFVVETGLSMIEAAFFNADLHVPASVLLGSTLTAVVRDGIAGAAMAWLWPARTDEAAPRLRGLFWKAPLLDMFYVVVYFGAGAAVMASATARTFYAHAPQMSLGGLALLQVARGLVWIALVFLLVRNSRRGLWVNALLTGAAFAVIMALQLLYPNPFLPWQMRQLHLVELLSSNMVFGTVAALVIAAGRRKD